jgi:NurA-like 5'-3' nuclease
MNITSKTTLQSNIEKIEAAANTAILATASAVHALNNSYNTLWGLNDDELTELLQYLLNEGKLLEVFTKHYVAATGLNKILDDGEYDGVRAIAVAGREFEIDEFGTLTLVVPPEPEILIEE